MKSIVMVFIALSFLNTAYAINWDSFSQTEQCKVISMAGKRVCDKLILMNVAPESLKLSNVFDREFYQKDAVVSIDASVSGESKTILYSKSTARPEDEQIAFFYLENGKVTKIAITTKYNQINKYEVPAEITSSIHFKNNLQAFIDAYKGKKGNSNRPLIESVQMSFLDEETLSESIFKVDESGKILESYSQDVLYVESAPKCTLPTESGWVEIDKVNNDNHWQDCVGLTSNWIDRSVASSPKVYQVSVASEILTSLKDVAKEVVSKGDAELNNLLTNDKSSIGQNEYSQLIAKTIEEITKTNNSLNFILNELGNGTREVIDSLEKDKKGNSLSILNDLREAKTIYDDLLIETIKTLSIGSQLKVQQVANQDIANSLNNTSPEARQVASVSQESPKTNALAADIKLALNEGNPQVILDKNSDLIKKIDTNGIANTSYNSNHQATYLASLYENKPATHASLIPSNTVVSSNPQSSNPVVSNVTTPDANSSVSNVTTPDANSSVSNSSKAPERAPASVKNYTAEKWVALGAKERYLVWEREFLLEESLAMERLLSSSQLSQVMAEDKAYALSRVKSTENQIKKFYEEYVNLPGPSWCPRPNIQHDMNDCMTPDGYAFRDGKKTSLFMGGGTSKIIPTAEEWTAMGPEGRAEARKKMLKGQLANVIDSLTSEQHEVVWSENGPWREKAIPQGFLKAGNVFDPTVISGKELEKMFGNPFGIFAPTFPLTAEYGDFLFMYNHTHPFDAGYKASVAFPVNAGLWQPYANVNNVAQVYVWVPEGWMLIGPKELGTTKYGYRFAKRYLWSIARTEVNDENVNKLTRDFNYFRNGGRR